MMAFVMTSSSEVVKAQLNSDKLTNEFLWQCREEAGKPIFGRLPGGMADTSLCPNTVDDLKNGTSRGVDQ
jgi:hypothetical protein